MPLRRGRRGFSLLNETALRLNLSFVLHEHSQSETVTETAHACERHARRIAKLAPGSLPMIPERTSSLPIVDLWLTAMLGLPAATVQTLSATGASVLFTDVHTETPTTAQPFFRATAQLSLPSDTQLQVGVGTVILRPGATSTILVTEGPFAWPSDRPAAIHALERLIEHYTDQWMPRASVWPSPAETLLGPDEIPAPEK